MACRCAHGTDRVAGLDHVHAGELDDLPGHRLAGHLVRGEVAVDHNHLIAVAGGAQHTQQVARPVRKGVPAAARQRVRRPGGTAHTCYTSSAPSMNHQGISTTMPIQQGNLQDGVDPLKETQHARRVVQRTLWSDPGNRGAPGAGRSKRPPQGKHCTALARSSGSRSRDDVRDAVRVSQQKQWATRQCHPRGWRFRRGIFSDAGCLGAGFHLTSSLVVAGR